MTNQCPNCQATLRANARFCNKCGRPITSAVRTASAPPAYSPPTYAPPPANQARAQAVAQQAAQQVAQVAGQAATAAAPIAQAAGQAALKASRQGMHWFSRLITLGGRAAFTEVTDPQPVAEGQITAGPTANNVPAPVEVGGWFFIFAFALVPLLFFSPDALTQLLSVLIAALLLLGLNFAGLRRPVFSKLTFGSLFRRYSNGVVPDLRFQFNDVKRGILNVRLLGLRRDGATLVAGQLVRLYGVQEGQTLRAWKIDVYGADGQPLGIVTAPRTLPLFAMLFVPLLIWFMIWVLTLVF